MPILRYATLLIALCLPGLAPAQDDPALRIELNAADTVGESCRLTFVLRNTLDQQIDQMIAETVLFSNDGQVLLLTLFDFGTLPVARPRVRQFQVPDASCDRLGMVLINGMDTCQVGDAASGACAAALSLSSRTPIGLEG